MRQTQMATDKLIKREWWVVDATNLTLGRMATEVANILRGKNKPYFSPHLDCGDYVIIINANKIVLTGNKLETKKYYNHSNYPGGLRVRTGKTMQERYPEEMVYRAIWGMMTHNRLGRSIIKKLHVYKGPEHKQQAQNPKELKINTKSVDTKSGDLK